MNDKPNPREMFRAIGTAMDFDSDNKIYGRKGTETIPWLHKKPNRYEDLALAIYEYFRSAGITVDLTYDPEDVDISAMLAANTARLEAVNG